LENTNATRCSCGILWYSRTFAESGAFAPNLLVFLCILVRFDVFCRIRSFSRNV
jgi:hypothetical protein